METVNGATSSWPGEKGVDPPYQVPSEGKRKIGAFCTGSRLPLVLEYFVNGIQLVSLPPPKDLLELSQL